MLHGIQSLIGFTLTATDGEIGKVKDFYFDDEIWKVRYLVVETGNWLFGRKVLLSPVALLTPDWNSKTFPVNLTKDQIKQSPDIDTDKPVTRLQVEELNTHYSWPYYKDAGMDYMTTGMVGGVVAPGIPFDEAISHEAHREDQTQHHSPHRDLHLRSMKQTIGYSIYAIDDELGSVDDFIIDTPNWSIPSLVAETGGWFTGKKILIPSNFVSKIMWETSSVYVDQAIDSLKNNAEFEYSNLNQSSTL